MKGDSEIPSGSARNIAEFDIMTFQAMLPRGVPPYGNPDMLSLCQAELSLPRNCYITLCHAEDRTVLGLPRL
jgi:hypothetical protein